MKDTSDLLNNLKSSKDIDLFLNGNKQEFITYNVSEYLSKLIDEYSLSKSEIIKKSGLDRTYGYQILNGKRTPSRDKLIQLAFGMDLSFDDVQKLLIYTGYAPLYAKNRRDSIIIYAIEKRLPVIDLNLMLDSKNEEILK